jgi:phosphoglucomutase
MNTHNFKIFVEALEALPASIKGDEVNIGSFLKPDHMCGTVGCFAGLISIVADDIPELKQACKGKFYNSCEWQYALDRYLECDFIKIMCVHFVISFVVCQMS